MTMYRLLLVALALSAVSTWLVQSSDTYQMIWSTDMSGGGMDEGGWIGPDGPWQAIKIYGSVSCHRREPVSKTTKTGFTAYSGEWGILNQ